MDIRCELSVHYGNMHDRATIHDVVGMININQIPMYTIYREFNTSNYTVMTSVITYYSLLVQS